MGEPKYGRGSVPQLTTLLSCGKCGFKAKRRGTVGCAVARRSHKMRGCNAPLVEETIHKTPPPARGRASS